MIIISPRKETTLPFGKHGNLESKATSEKRENKKKTVGGCSAPYQHPTNGRSWTVARPFKNARLAAGIVYLIIQY